MSDGLNPTEEYNGGITVRLLDDEDGTDVIECSSYKEAIEVVKEHRRSVTAAKIIGRGGEVQFTSANTDIETWERVWQREKRSLGVNVETYVCPYENISCFADDLCVQCKMDKLQNM